MDTKKDEEIPGSKEKPHPQMLREEANIRQLVFNEYKKEMEERNREYSSRNNNEICFKLAQDLVSQDEFINQVLNISYFYDMNFTGNKDFMNIPDIKKVATNLMNYPIMVATKKGKDGSEEIIGITTMKFENNRTIDSNPIFPTKNENVLFITGLLTKNYDLCPDEAKVIGIGKELCKASIRGAYNICMKTGSRLVCEVDCRNLNSFKAFSKAVLELNEENMYVEANICGYYEIFSRQNRLVEAPTFIVEFEFYKEDSNDDGKTKFSYTDCKSSRLYSDLSKCIRENTKENIKFITTVDNGFVVFHDTKKINILQVELEVGNSADGNCRVPVLNPFVELIK